MEGVSWNPIYKYSLIKVMGIPWELYRVRPLFLIAVYKNMAYILGIVHHEKSGVMGPYL